MSTTQGNSLKITTSVLKVIDGLLCSTLPKIFESPERKEKLNNAVFSCIGNGGEDEETILKNLNETIITSFLDDVKRLLKNEKVRKALVDDVANAIIDHAKLIDEKIKLQNNS